MCGLILIDSKGDAHARQDQIMPRMPDRVADPNCHGTCKGYIGRVEQKEIENRERRLLNATYITDVDFEKRNRAYQSEKDDKKRRR